MKITFLCSLFLFLFQINAFAQAHLEYRINNDNGAAMARARFSRDFQSYFNHKKTQLGLGHLTLGHSKRMMGQRGRGHQSAYRVLPRVLDQILIMISLARKNPRGLVQELASNNRYGLRYLSDQELAHAVSVLANTRKVWMDFWGYFPPQELIMPKLNSQRMLSYYVQWNDGGEGKYIPGTVWNLRANLIRGILQSL